MATPAAARIADRRDRDTARPAVQMLSILIPVYNEAATLSSLLERLAKIEFPVSVELVLVNDGSSDGSTDLLERYAQRPGCRVAHHPRNRGKSAAIRTAMQLAQGDVWVIQDADLEYDPAELPRLLEPIARGEADVVYGTRFHAGGERMGMRADHALANRLLTWLTNRLYGCRLTDMETCYKMARASVFRALRLEANGFDLEPEITAKILRRGCAILELPIGFAGRNKRQGKKIGWGDGCSAVWTLFRCRWQRLAPAAGELTRAANAGQMGGGQK